MTSDKGGVNRGQKNRAKGDPEGAPLAVFNASGEPVRATSDTGAGLI